jgi:hypothetical protein
MRQDKPAFRHFRTANFRHDKGDAMVRFSENTMLKAWGVFFVLALISGLIAGAVAGGLTGVIVVAVTGSEGNTPLYAGLAGFVAALPFSYLSFRFAVRKFLVNDIAASEGVD